MKTAPLFACLALAASFSIGLSARAQGSPPATPDDHQPPVSAKINALAHRLLQAGLKANTLAGDGLKPWHMKVDFQMLTGGSPKPVSGTVEAWSTGPDQWSRTFAGAQPGMNGTEWSVSKIARFQSKPGHDGFNYAFLDLRVARPVISPLYQAANIQPDYEMEVKRVNTAGLTLNCVSVVNPTRYAPQSDPDWLFPTMCFDPDLHLRLTVAGDTSVQFDDVQTFQDRAVARDVKVIQKGSLISEMKVSVLEPLAAADAAHLTPDPKAISEPYHIEPGFPPPESVYEVAAALPISHQGFPYLGTLAVPILIHKDGTVKVVPHANGAPVDLSDAISLAISKWKFKPYLVDGQPVEVAYTIGYLLDGKPFVPSYERTKSARGGTGPDDYFSVYDPKRDPAKDLVLAEAAAAQGHRRILVEVGGDWCIWCRFLDQFFADHADARILRDSNFVLMKVNMSAVNENSAFLGNYPKIPGYPWIFVLDSDGKMLKSEDTNELEDRAGGYSAKNIRDFLTSWKP